MTSEGLEQNSPKSGAANDVSRDSDLLTVMVGIPCYNEEVAIGSLVVRASQYADRVVVLDDGSTDKTAEVARLVSPDVNVTDTQSGFRAFSMKAARTFQFNTDQLAIDSEMLMDAAKAGLRIKEVDISVRYDVGHSSSHPVAHGIQVLAGVLRNIEFKKPLLAFTVPGLICIGIGVALAVYVVQGFYYWGHVPN